MKKLAQNLTILLPKGCGRCARPLDTLAAEKNFSDAHVVRKIIRLLRVCGRELCEASYAAAANAYAEQRFSVYRCNDERQRRKKEVDASYETTTTMSRERVVKDGKCVHGIACADS